MESDEDENWVQCHTCERWMHQKCTKIEVTDNTWNNMMFLCVLCTEFNK